MKDLIKQSAIDKINSMSELELYQIVDFYDTVTSSTDMIEMSAVAKILSIPGYGRNKIFKILQNEKILRRDNEPFQEFVDRGYFKSIIQKVPLPCGFVKISRKTIISQRGLEFIKKILIQTKMDK